MGEASTLLQLAERCEQATGPDINLDVEIAQFVNDMLPDEGSVRWQWKPSHISLPRYTSSLDAAMRLVPERHQRDLMLSISPMSVDMGGKDWKAVIGGIRNRASGRTPALALCAAALRARAAQPPEPSGAGQ